MEISTNIIISLLVLRLFAAPYWLAEELDHVHNLDCIIAVLLILELDEGVPV
jgi:hypothetical protein